MSCSGDQTFLLANWELSKAVAMSICWVAPYLWFGMLPLKWYQLLHLISDLKSVANSFQFPPSFIVSVFVTTNGPKTRF